MKDYKQRIQDRTNIKLTEELLNIKVNWRLNNGLSIQDALDYAYFHIINNY